MFLAFVILVTCSLTDPYHETNERNDFSIIDFLLLIKFVVFLRIDFGWKFYLFFDLKIFIF